MAGRTWIEGRLCRDLHRTNPFAKAVVTRLAVAPGVDLWREKFSPLQQKALLDDVLERLKDAPLYRPVMPGTAAPFSVEESSFGTLGWVADKTGYRYQPVHPVTGKAWPANAAEPAEPLIKHEETKLKGQGKCAIWATPFSGEPVFFDDIKISVEAAAAP